MNNDQINALLALMGQQIKEQAELCETSDRRFAPLTDVMVNGFLRLEDRLGARIDNVSARVDRLAAWVVHLTGEVKEIKEDVREVKTQGQKTNRCLGNVFEHTGQLTEASEAAGMRPSYVEEDQLCNAS